MLHEIVTTQIKDHEYELHCTDCDWVGKSTDPKFFDAVKSRHLVLVGVTKLKQDDEEDSE